MPIQSDSRDQYREITADDILYQEEDEDDENEGDDGHGDQASEQTENAVEYYDPRSTRSLGRRSSRGI